MTIKHYVLRFVRVWGKTRTIKHQQVAPCLGLTIAKLYARKVLDPSKGLERHESQIIELVDPDTWETVATIKHDPKRLQLENPVHSLIGKYREERTQDLLEHLESPDGYYQE